MRGAICGCVLVLFLACDVCTASRPYMYGLFKGGKYLHTVSWEKFMIGARWFSNEVIEMARPHVLEKYPFGNVSEVCTQSLLSYVDGLRDWKKWAVRMFDTTGKIPSSFKIGAGIEFGSYDDCVRIVSDDSSFVGQFCMLHLQTSTTLFIDRNPALKTFKESASLLIPGFGGDKRNLDYHLGVCAPSSCSEEELFNIISAFAKSSSINVTLSDCETKEGKKLSDATTYALYILECLSVLCLLGTILDLRDSDTSTTETPSVLRESLKSFSIYSNCGHLFEKESISLETRRIIGVMCLMCAWVITCSTIIYPTRWKDMRYTTVQDFFMAIKFANWNVVGMDALFFTSGYLSIFVLWRTYQKNGEITNLLKAFLKASFRWIPMNAFIIGFSFILPLIYYGPLWNRTWSKELDKCQMSGWLNLFNFQTQLPLNEICWKTTWYSALGFQFLLASIPLVWLLFKSPKIGFGSGIASIAFILSTLHNSEEVVPQLPASLPSQYFELARLMVIKYYSKPLLYLLPYLFGILSGWITLNFKHQELPKALEVTGWCLSLALCDNVLSNTDFMKAEYSSIDAARRTFMLSLAITWILYASITEGYIGRTLSSNAVLAFAKASVGAYLLHPLLLVVREAALKERIFIGKLTLSLEAISLVVCSYLLSMITFMAVEVPFARLFDIFFGDGSVEETVEIEDKKATENSVENEQKEIEKS